MKKQKNIRMSSLTERQLSTLANETGMSQTELISTAIDRMYREEIRMTDEQLFDLFVAHGTTADEIAGVDAEILAQQIDKMRNDESDNIPLTSFEIARRILRISQHSQ